MKPYKQGLVSAQLFGSSSSSKQNGLASLFVPKPAPKTPKIKKSPAQPIQQVQKLGSHAQAKSQNIIQSKPVRNVLPKPGKNVQSTPESQQSKKSTPVWSAPFVHETLVKDKSKLEKSPGKSAPKRKLEKPKTDENEEFSGKRPRRDRIRDKQSDNRTVFVGNCPLSADKKVLKSLFREFGEIESIRFRCAPPADPDLPRRAIVITKNYHEQCKSYVAYIVFKEEAAAKKALVRNGHLLDGLHLRVDISSMSKKHDKKRSVFVGNLPFDITEEGIYSHFEDCGEIKNVRIVRDRQTSLGKGIGYVQFDSKDSVGLALKLNKTKVQGREIRVMVCTNKPEKLDKKKKGKKDDDEKKRKTKPKKPMFGPSNSTVATFQAKLKIKKDKHLRKLKKRKENAKKSEDLSSTDPLAAVGKSSKPKLRGAGGKKSKQSVKKSGGPKGKKVFSKGKNLKKGPKGKQGKEKNFKKKS